MPAACPVQAAAADKSYDSDASRADLKRRGIEPVIPPLRCRKEAIPSDKKTYRRRNEVERRFNRLKQFRRVATRYDRNIKNFIATISIAATVIWWLK